MTGTNGAPNKSGTRGAILSFYETYVNYIFCSQVFIQFEIRLNVVRSPFGVGSVLMSLFLSEVTRAQSTRGGSVLGNCVLSRAELIGVEVEA